MLRCSALRGSWHGLFFLHIKIVCVWWLMVMFVPSIQVYRRGLQAIPLSVDLWLHYLTFFKENSDNNDPETDTRIRA